MKKVRICLIALCLLLACTGSAYASATYTQKYPINTDILLYESFLCKLQREGVEVTHGSASTTTEYKDGVPYAVSVYEPADGLQFEIAYRGGKPAQYSIYFKFVESKQALDERALALKAFSLTFFENTWEEAFQTVQSLTNASETDESGSRFSRLVRDDATLGFENKNDYISLHYIIP